MRLGSLLLASCAALALHATAALAADYDPPIFVEEAPEWVPVEIGSGWYLRGDVAYTFDREFIDTTARLDDTIFDLGDLVTFPGTPLDIVSLSARRTPVSGTVGFGYHVNDFLRAEVNLGLLANDRYAGTGYLNADTVTIGGETFDVGCLGTRTITTIEYDADGNQVGVPAVTVDDSAREGCDVSASLRNSAWTGTVNAYADLGTFSGFTPYVGVGGGLVYTRTRFAVNAQCAATQTDTTTPGPGAQTQTIDTFLCQGQTGPGDEPVTYNPVNLRHADYNFLYSLHAGFAYQLSQNTKLDVGYQYTSVPKYEGADFHQVKVGLRYDLW